MKKINEKLEKVLKSKILVGIIYGALIIVVLMIVFCLGIRVGFHKAFFSRNWGDNYERNFGMRPDKPGFRGENFPNAHGAIGKIIKIELPNIIVQDKDDVEKVILIKENTLVQKMKDNINKEDLKIDDFIVIIGTPNKEGQIEAKFIRLMPEPNLLNINNSKNQNEKPF